MSNQLNELQQFLADEKAGAVKELENFLLIGQTLLNDLRGESDDSVCLQIKSLSLISENLACCAADIKMYAGDYSVLIDDEVA